jgi:hypothetical protein
MAARTRKVSDLLPSFFGSTLRPLSRQSVRRTLQLIDEQEIPMKLRVVLPLVVVVALSLFYGAAARAQLVLTDPRTRWSVPDHTYVNRIIFTPKLAGSPLPPNSTVVVTFQTPAGVPIPPPVTKRVDAKGDITLKEGDIPRGATGSGNQISITHTDGSGTVYTGGPLVYTSGEVVAARPQVAPTVVTGLVTPEFVTRNGSLKVFLPDDATAGDTISGAVITEPAGKNTREKAKNEDELNGYVVDVENTRTQVGQRWGKWVLPVGAAAMTLVLRNKKGEEIARQSVPVRPMPIDPVKPGAAPALPGDYKLPQGGQVGKPIQVHGPFSGDLNASSVKVGGQPCLLLAESPRKLVVLSPHDVIGPGEIEVREKEVVCKGTYRNVAVGLSVLKTLLHTGEHTTLSLKLQGLKGITQPLSVWLTNRTPGIMHMDGGEVQAISVPPGAVTEEGAFTATVPLTGVQLGAFTIAATLVDPPEGPLGGDEDEFPKDSFKGEGEILDALKRRDELAAKSAAEDEENPGSVQGRELHRVVKDQEDAVKKRVSGLTPAQRTTLYKDLAKWYRKRAERQQSNAAEENDPAQKRLYQHLADEDNREAGKYDKEAAAAAKEGSAP